MSEKVLTTMALGDKTRNSFCDGAKKQNTMKIKIVVVNDKMQKNYFYTLTEPIGKNFDPTFKPELTPKEMLELGVFGGKYMTDCIKEFPSAWFKKAKFSPLKKEPKLNFFVVCKDQGEKCYDSNGCKDDKCKNYAQGGSGSAGCVDTLCKDIQECSDFNLCTDNSSCEDSNECTDVTKCTDVSTCENYKCVNSADCTHSANCKDYDCQYDSICIHNPGQCTHIECEPEGD